MMKKNPFFRISWILGKDFLPLSVVEFFPLENNCRDAWSMVFSWQEVRWISNPHTQISQSFTSSQCRNPYFSPHSLCMKVSSTFRQLCPSPLQFLVVNFPLHCKPPTESRTWEKVLDLSETLLWLHLLCLPSTAGPDCPASQRNTVHRGNPAPQWTMVETPGAPLSVYLGSRACWLH